MNGSEKLQKRALGSTGLEVTPVGIGGSPLGGAKGLYGHDTSSEDAVATVLRVFDSPFNLLDTSNAYSEGRSEQRIGEAIQKAGGLPAGFVLVTKVDADPETRAYDRDRVLRSFEESIARLGVETIDLLFLHDPETDLTVEEALDSESGAVAGLIELRNAGVVGSIGIAGGAASEMAQYVDSGVFDVLLTHNRYTLVDRTADGLIDLAHERGMGVINAAPFGGGVLARDVRPGDRYAYGLGTAAQVEVAREMKLALGAFGIPIAAAALQFSLRERRIHSTLFGASSPERVQQALQLIDVIIPEDVWVQLERMLPPRASWIND